jgi:hypothetical protein
LAEVPEIGVNEQIMKVLVPALLALFGTGFGLWLGQRRWSTELRMKKRRAFDARRYAAYEELWRIVESAHITIRTGRPETSEVHQLSEQVNAFRLQNAIFLEPLDSELSNRYFNSVVRLAKAIAESGSRELQERFALTNTIPEADVAKLGDLVKANANATRLRDELMARVRTVMLETSYAAGSGNGNS